MLEGQVQWLSEIERKLAASPHISMTTMPAAGNAGSSPPVRAAAIRPQSG